MNRRVVVTGVGFVSPHGSDLTAAFDRLMNGESAIRVVKPDQESDYTNIAAAVTEDVVRLLPADVRPDSIDRVSQFAVAAAIAAVRDSGIVFDDELRQRTGVSYGTGMGSSNTLQETFQQVMLRDPARVRPLTVVKVMNNAPAAHIAMHCRLAGPDLTYSVACSSSAVSIGEAFRQIRHGYADAMIAGGAEASLTSSFFRSWDAMRVLAPVDRNDPPASCRPFSKNRSGLVLGEGAAMIVLEEREAALRRGAAIYAELAGYASTNDDSHITKPSVEAQSRAMALALADARVDASDVDYINAHGTATALNDSTETAAIRRVFGSHADRLAVSSTKSMHGHLLGGAGALEFAISLLAMRRAEIPPTANLDVPDPECDLDYVPGKGRPKEIRALLSNSFAFGGTNAVLVARRA